MRETETSPLFNTLMEDTFFRGIYERGREEGRREGLEEGRAEARREVHRQAESRIARVLLERRFGKLPEWVPEKLQAATLPELHEWAIRTLSAATLMEVFEKPS